MRSQHPSKSSAASLTPISTPEFLTDRSTSSSSILSTMSTESTESGIVSPAQDRRTPRLGWNIGDKGSDMRTAQKPAGFELWGKLSKYMAGL
ncbi:hypothetical protein HDV00_012188 [Rhizophlyctis rosea]|nr:hypothetical protein HDV00_012188 [Rhizophlyctis rosea]